MRFCAVLVCAGLLAGCATKYQDMGFTGGVTAERVTADTFRIISRGNAYTNSTAVQDYALLKAAETTKANGGTHFLVVSANDATSASVGQTPSTMQTHLVGRTAFTTFNPGATYTIVRPGQDAYIKVITVPRGAAPPAGAFSADEIIQHVGSRVQRAS